MSVGERYTCLFCLTEHSYEMRLDKHGRPYFLCSSCGARTFLRGEVSLRGPSMLWGALSRTMRAGDVEASRALVAQGAQHAVGA